jgi:hypothetical protein
MEICMNILTAALAGVLFFGGLTEAALAHSASPQSSRTSSAQVMVPPAVPASEDSDGSGNKQQDNNSPEAVKAYWDKVLFKSR